MKRTVMGTMLSIVAIAAAVADMFLLFFSPSTNLASASGTPSASSGPGSGGTGSQSGPGLRQPDSNDNDSDTGTDSDTDDNATDDNQQSNQQSGAYADGTYTGQVVSTEFGDVQLRVTVESGKISQIEALAYPNQDRHSQMISTQAIPAYTNEAIEAQSASIQLISGATETYNAFTGSLQSALNQASGQ